MEPYQRLILHVLLCINAYEDVKHRKIEWKSVLSFGAAGIFLQSGTGLEGLKEALFGMVPGVLLLLVAKLSREAVGYGDGFLVTAAGIYAGLQKTFELLLGAVIAAAVYGTLMLVRRKADRKTELPFVPFVLFSYVGGMLIEKI